MSRKYDIKYLEPDLSEYNKYPQLIKAWKNNLDINQLQNNEILDYEQKVIKDERRRFINISGKREQRISPAEFQDYLKNIKLEDKKIPTFISKMGNDYTPEISYTELKEIHQKSIQEIIKYLEKGFLIK